MPNLHQAKLADAATGTGAQPAVDVRSYTAASVFIKATGGTTSTSTLEVTADPTGAAGWATAAARPAGGGSYVTTGVVVAAGASTSLYLAPEDNICWIRLNISANSSSVDALVNLEQ